MKKRSIVMMIEKEFVPPKTSAEASGRIQTVMEAISEINVDLKSRNVVGPEGRRLSPREYTAWQQEAYARKKILVREYQALESWFKQRGGKDASLLKLQDVLGEQLLQELTIALASGRLQTAALTDILHNPLVQASTVDAPALLDLARQCARDTTALQAADIMVGVLRHSLHPGDLEALESHCRNATGTDRIKAHAGLALTQGYILMFRYADARRVALSIPVCRERSAAMTAWATASKHEAGLSLVRGAAQELEGVEAIKAVSLIARAWGSDQDLRNLREQVLQLPREEPATMWQWVEYVEACLASRRSDEARDALTHLTNPLMNAAARVHIAQAERDEKILPDIDEAQRLFGMKIVLLQNLFSAFCAAGRFAEARAGVAKIENAAIRTVILARLLHERALEEEDAEVLLHQSFAQITEPAGSLQDQARRAYATAFVRFSDLAEAVRCASRILQSQIRSAAYLDMHTVLRGSAEELLESEG